MQWDKVKNILIAILLTINLFLLGNLAVRGWQSHRRTSELEANLRTLVSAMKAAGDIPYIIGSIEAGEKGVTLC